MDKEIGEFLRARRARVTPEQAGLEPGFGQRRVAGLRREELAQLAGVSVDYYVRLEQGRSANVSDTVLDAVARVLGLDAVEREHLSNLARPGGPGRAQARAQRVAPALQRLLDLMDGLPVLVLGRRMDIVAWNAAADIVFGISSMGPGRNAARETFLNPRAQELYPNWESVAAEAVGYLRLDAGRHPRDPQLAGLVGELSISSAQFRRLWARHDVHRKTTGRTLLMHPVAGALEFEYTTLGLATDHDQLVVAYAFAEGSPTDERLQVLGSWTAGAGPGRRTTDAAEPA